MNNPRSRSLSKRSRLVRFLIPASASLSLLAGSLLATPVPANLGNGLGKLVESNLILKGQIEVVDGQVRLLPSSGKGANRAARVGEFNGYATPEAASYGALGLTEATTGRLLVRITLNGRLSADALKESLAKVLPGVTVTSIDPTYRGTGVMNAYVSVDEVPALSQADGVAAVILELKPRHNRVAGSATSSAKQLNGPPTVGQTYPTLGTAFDQGVTQHRVTSINRFYNAGATSDFQGSGLKIACLSNAFASNPTFPPSVDVTNNDLPGNANNPVGNTTPVFILKDDPNDSLQDDEGRGMCQILYKMAPKAKIGFASANFGEVGFANAIRGLAGINSSDFPTASTNGFAADVVCDDVGYFDEPYFQDGIIAQGIEDVAAAGVSYFSSAANDIGVNGYDSDLRWVPNGTGLTAAAGNTALTGTNLNLANVPVELYAGGFHNFNPAAGQQDVAQTVNIQSAANGQPPTILQWNEPYDQNATPNYVLPAIFTATNTYAGAAQNYTVSATLTAGTLYELQERAVGSSFDGIVTVRDPAGNIIVNAQDTTVDENVRFFAPVTGANYTITITAFGGTTGAYSLNLFATTGFSGPGVITRISLLAFTTAGGYVPGSSLTTNAYATNQPIQLGVTARSGGAQLQYVICRAVVPNPSSPNVATRVRYLIPGNGLPGIGPAEYFTYNTVTTGGHATAPNCNGAAAYDVARPSVPQDFTSPGPAVFYFDRNSNKLATPDVRLKPTIAAANGANISMNEGNAGLGGDSQSDIDLNPEFFGTSAASPHAAAIALLVLEAKGGRRSVTPAQMTSILSRSTYPHDLDPHFASGSARTTTGGKVTISISSDNEANTGTGRNDNNAFSISYVGLGQLTSFVFNPQGTPATAGGTVSGRNGLNATGAYFNDTANPGMYFAFTGTGGKAFAIGSGSSAGFTTTNTTAALSNAAATPAPTGNGQTLTLTFTGGVFNGGNVLRFGVGRGLQRGPNVVTPAALANYSADLFGGGISLPEGTGNGNGMTFSGTTSDGATFSGVIVNRIGSGWSRLDGFGFINAEAAVAAPIQ